MTEKLSKVTVEEYVVEGRRYPLTVGAVAKVKGRRGNFRIVRIDSWSNGQVEALTWHTSGGVRSMHAQYVTIQLEGPIAVEIKSISKG